MAESSSSGGGLIAVALIAGIVVVVFPTLNPGRESHSQNLDITQPLFNEEEPLHEQDDEDIARYLIEGDHTIPEVREVHYAADKNQCLQLEKLFKRNGIRLDLYWSGDVTPSPNSPFQGRCVFTGPDAGIHSLFQDNRYNRPRDY